MTELITSLNINELCRMYVLEVILRNSKYQHILVFEELESPVGPEGYPAMLAGISFSSHFILKCISENSFSTAMETNYQKVLFALLSSELRLYRYEFKYLIFINGKFKYSIFDYFLLLSRYLR